MIAQGRNYITIDDIYKRVTDSDILSFYFGINKIPCLVNSPLRQDNKPSMGFYTTDGEHIKWKDFSTNECGGVFNLLRKYFNLSFDKTLEKVYNEVAKTSNKIINVSHKHHYKKSESTLNVKIREWREYDIKYWESYGITLKWLNWAEVYPISHKIITKDDQIYIFGAEKYAYAYVEHKEGNTTLKIYQPFSKDFKWCNKHDKSVVSLWTKIPEKGKTLVICSSLKDALCLSCQTNIPAIAPQGEGYSMSKTAIDNLKSRYENIFILFDNDAPGLSDGANLALNTGFTNVVLPKINNAKDISDLYKSLSDKKEFKQILYNLLNIKQNGKQKNHSS